MDLVRRMPWLMVLSASVLALVGLLSIVRSVELMDSGVSYAGRQAAWMLAAAAVAFVLGGINYRRWIEFSYPLYMLLVALLIAAFFSPPINGAHRWLRIGTFGLQPSEFAKIGLILALARYLMHCEQHRALRGLAPPFALALAPLLLVLREPDLGTALVFLPVLFAMLAAAAANPRHLLLAAMLGIALLPLLWNQMSREQRSRVTALFEQMSPAERPTDDGYHLYQAKRVMAQGGLWGTAVTGDMSAAEAIRLPVAHSDFIFSVIGERFGIWGMSAVLTAFAGMVLAMLAVAGQTREPFGRLITVGVAALFGFETIVNTAMTVGLAPVTGLSLPLVSYGGSGLVAHAAALGLVVSVALYPGYEIAGNRFPEPRGKSKFA